MSHGSGNAYVLERLQAIAGPLPDTIRKVSDVVVKTAESNKDFKIQTTRARIFQNVASVVFLIAKAPSQPLPTFTSLEKWLIAISAIKNVREDMIMTFTKFMSLVSNPRFSRPITRVKLSPAEFIMVGYLISLVRESCSDEEISRAVSELRDVVRAAHTDIRTNNTVFKTMFSFVNDFQNKLARKTARSSKRKREPDSLEIAEPSRKRPSLPTRPTTTPVPGPLQISFDPPSTQTAVSTARRPATRLTTSFATFLPPDSQVQKLFLSHASPSPRGSAGAVSPTAPTSQKTLDPLALIEEAKRKAREYQATTDCRAQQSHTNGNPYFLVVHLYLTKSGQARTILRYTLLVANYNRSHFIGRRS